MERCVSSTDSVCDFQTPSSGFFYHCVFDVAMLRGGRSRTHCKHCSSIFHDELSVTLCRSAADLPLHLYKTDVIFNCISLRTSSITVKSKGFFNLTSFLLRCHTAHKIACVSTLSLAAYFILIGQWPFLSTFCWSTCSMIGLSSSRLCGKNNIFWSICSRGTVEFWMSLLLIVGLAFCTMNFLSLWVKFRGFSLCEQNHPIRWEKAWWAAPKTTLSSHGLSFLPGEQSVRVFTSWLPVFSLKTHCFYLTWLWQRAPEKTENALAWEGTQKERKNSGRKGLQ